jgi:hypothetical protein
MTHLAAAADADYVTGIQKWRQDFDADVRTGGWLALIGRFPVAEGTMTLGSGRTRTVQLPARVSQRFLGTMTRHGERVRFEPAPHVHATIDGKRHTGWASLSTQSGSGRVQIGNLRLSVRSIGEDFYLLAADLRNPAIQDFRGTTWFPIDPAYRIAATFKPYAQPEKVRVSMSHVESKSLMTSTGDLSFQLAGRTVSLKTFIDDNELFVMFQDETNGSETYGGGRFVNAPLPKDGETVIDFNKAFNPYCSLNSYILCPIPPPENRIDSKIPAGETYGVNEVAVMR